MNTNKSVIFLFVYMSFQVCIAQQIENYTKGEIEIKVASFGYENPLTVGKVAEDGKIHFTWPEMNLDTTENSDMYMTSIQEMAGGSFCKDPDALFSNENAKLVKVDYIYVHKYGQRVGSIIPSTQKDQEHRKDQLGTTLYWVFSDSETSANTTCVEKMEWEGAYSFDKITTYDLQFSKGWNLVSTTLEEMEEWDNGTEKGSLPKIIKIKSVDKIPDSIHWNLNYWANDELLEKEQQLMMLKPIAKEKYENWLPKKLGNLKRASFEIGKELERLPTTNNINMIFEKGQKTIDLTIVDCAANKEAASVFTLMEDMASRDWRDENETGYKSASKIGDKRVITDYDQKEAKTLITYNSNQRFTVKAEATNLTPEELWEQLKALDLETLLED